MKVLLTAIGSPGGVPTIRALHEQGCTVVGTDARTDAVAAQFVDRFYQVPRGLAPGYVPCMREIAERERPDVVLPQSSYEIRALAGARETLGAPAMVPSAETAAICADKIKTYEALRGSGVPVPRYVVCKDAPQLVSALCAFGAPQKRVVVKTPDGSGARGVRIVVPRLNRLTFAWRDWPNPILMTYEEVLRDARDARYPLMVMEDLNGEAEQAVDLYCDDGEVLGGCVREKRQDVHGLHSHHRAIDDAGLWRYAVEIARRLRLHHFANVQFLNEELLEVHARRSTLMYAGGFNLLWAGVRYATGAAGREAFEGMRLAQGARLTYYWDALDWMEEER